MLFCLVGNIQSIFHLAFAEIIAKNITKLTKAVANWKNKSYHFFASLIQNDIKVKQKKSVIKCIPLQLEFSIYKMYCPSDLFYLLFIGFNKNADAMLLIERKKRNQRTKEKQ